MRPLNFTINPIPGDEGLAFDAVTLFAAALAFILVLFS